MGFVSYDIGFEIRCELRVKFAATYGHYVGFVLLIICFAWVDIGLLRFVDLQLRLGRDWLGGLEFVVGVFDEAWSFVVLFGCVILFVRLSCLGLASDYSLLGTVFVGVNTSGWGGEIVTSFWGWVLSVCVIVCLRECLLFVPVVV